MTQGQEQSAYVVKREPGVALIGGQPTTTPTARYMVNTYADGHKTYECGECGKAYDRATAAWSHNIAHNRAARSVERKAKAPQAIAATNEHVEVDPATLALLESFEKIVQIARACAQAQAREQELAAKLRYAEKRLANIQRYFAKEEKNND